MFKVYYKYNSNCSNKANEVADDFSIDHEDDTFDTVDEIYDDLFEFIDSTMIYTDDQWDLLKEYTTPSDLTEYSLCEAFECLQSEAYSCLKIEEIDEDENDEDDEDFDDEDEELDD